MMVLEMERLREWEEAQNRQLREWADELRDRSDAAEPGTVAVSLEETLGLARAVNEFVYADGGRRKYERMDLVGGLEDWAGTCSRRGSKYTASFRPSAALAGRRRPQRRWTRR